MLSDKEKDLIDKINANQAEEVRLLLDDKDIRLNVGDESGMSPLLHAAYKGNYELARLLIERGADVNFDQHAHKYSALMFAAIGGYVRVVNLLLESGANVNHLNSLNRTASQMAAFVGQHKVVQVINNFLPLSQLDYFTRTHGLEKEPRLKKHLLQPLNRFLRIVNIHPVRILFELNRQPELVRNLKSVAFITQALCDKEMTQSPDPNEALALKFSYLTQLLLFYDRQLSQARERLGEAADIEHKTSETIIKTWIDGRQHAGFPQKLEEFIRNCVREFKYRDCAMFVNLVRTLSSVRIGDEPSALTMMCQSINGQKGFVDDTRNCLTCGEVNPPKKCSKCKVATYCDATCQRLHWPTHKFFCEQMRTQREQEEAVQQEMLRRQQEQEEEEAAKLEQQPQQTDSQEKLTKQFESELAI